MKNLEQIIDKFVGKDTKGTFDMNAIREAEERGYNYAKAEIRSRKQELIEGIYKLCNQYIKIEKGSKLNIEISEEMYLVPRKIFKRINM